MHVTAAGAIDKNNYKKDNSSRNNNSSNDNNWKKINTCTPNTALRQHSKAAVSADDNQFMFLAQVYG